MLKVFNYLQSFWSSKDVNYSVAVISDLNNATPLTEVTYTTGALSLVESPTRGSWFNRSSTRYRIILKQHDKGFVLAECYTEENGFGAFNSINKTLSPFLNDGSILFTKKLLECLIIPNPSISQLIHVMEEQSDAYPYWYKIGHVLNNTFTPGPPEEVSTEHLQMLKCNDQLLATHPLYTSITNGFIKSTLYLLQGGADPNTPIDSQGNTPLHLAAEKGDIILIKLLVAFEGDTRVTNCNGQLPLDKALQVNAFDCAVVLKQVSLLLDSYDNLSTDLNKKDENNSFLLSLDGGGVRAIMEIQMLIAIEKRMKKINPHSSLLNSFDYIAGTSGGAYVLFITLYGKKSLKESRSLVFSAMNRLSQSASCTERVSDLEDMLQEMLGTELVMSDLQSPRVIVTSSLVDRCPSKLHLITNYGEPRDGQSGPNERKAWEAARITSAVPIFLNSYDGKFLDGGLMSNNPTLDAMNEINEQNDKISLVVSLGTGVTPDRSITNIDISLPSLSFSSLYNLPQSLKGLKNLGEILLLQLTRTDGQHVNTCKTWCDNIGASYYRISPPVNTSHSLNESNVDNIIGMLYDAQIHVLKEAHTINEIAKTLLTKNL